MPNTIPFCFSILFFLATVIAPGFAYLPAEHTGIIPTTLQQDTDISSVGHLDATEFSLVDVAIHGTFAYTANAMQGPNESERSDFITVDVTDPTHMREINRIRFSSRINQILINGTAVYLATAQQGLQLLSIADPQHPIVIGSLAIAEPIGKLLLAGRYVYLLAVGYGLRVVDISNPAHPVEIGAYANASIKDFALVGTYVYGLTSATIEIITRAKPNHLQLAAIYQLSVNSNDQFTNVMLVGYYVYATKLIELCNGIGGCAYAYRMHVLDTASPTHPREVNEIGIEGPPQTILGAYLIAGVQLISIADPAKPAVAGNFPLGFRGIAPIGDYAVLATASGLIALKIAHTPRIVVGDILAGFQPQLIAQSGDFIYAYQVGFGLHIIDITNPARPAEIGKWIDPAIETAPYADILATDGFVYIATGSYATLVIDVHDPTHPVQVNLITGFSYQLTIANSYLYVNSGNDGLRIFSLADPAYPQLIGQLKDDNIYWTVIAGTYAYMVGWDASSGRVFNRLQIADISDPTNPKLVGVDQNNTDQAYRVAVAGNYAYVTGTNLRILDISNPASPVLASTYPLPTGLSTLVAQNQLLYVATDKLHIFDISDPTQPSESASFLKPDDLLLGDNYLYTVDTGGLSILQFVGSIQAAPDQAATLTGITPSDTSAWFQFPTGTVTATTTFTYTPVLAFPSWSGSVAAHRSFELLADQHGQLINLIFETPVTMTLHYDDTKIPFIIDKSQLVLMHWTASGWEDATLSCPPQAREIRRDLANQTLSMPICQTGQYALVGPTHSLFLPLSQMRL